MLRSDALLFTQDEGSQITNPESDEAKGIAEEHKVPAELLHTAPDDELDAEIPDTELGERHYDTPSPDAPQKTSLTIPIEVKDINGKSSFGKNQHLVFSPSCTVAGIFMTLYRFPRAPLTPFKPGSNILNTEIWTIDFGIDR